MDCTINNLLAFLGDVGGYSQAEIAEKVGISRSHVSEIYSGKKEVSVKLLKKFGRVYNVNAGDLLILVEVDLSCDSWRKELTPEHVWAIGILFQRRCQKDKK